MLRFIDIGKQCGPGPGVDEDWPREFAFFDTVTDSFIRIAGEQVWDSWIDLDASIGFARGEGDQADKQRLKKLCPEWVFTCGDTEKS